MLLQFGFNHIQSVKEVGTQVPAKLESLSIEKNSDGDYRTQVYKIASAIEKLPCEVYIECGSYKSWTPLFERDVNMYSGRCEEGEIPSFITEMITDSVKDCI